jgi:hypothetical protein
LPHWSNTEKCVAPFSGAVTGAARTTACAGSSPTVWKPRGSPGNGSASTIQLARRTTAAPPACGGSITDEIAPRVSRSSLSA